MAPGTVPKLSPHAGRASCRRWRETLSLQSGTVDLWREGKGWSVSVGSGEGNTPLRQVEAGSVRFYIQGFSNPRKMSC